MEHFITDLWPTSRRIWASSKPEFRLCWMKLCSSELVNFISQKMLFHHFYGVAFSFFVVIKQFSEYRAIPFFCLLCAFFFLFGDRTITYAVFLEICGTMSRPTSHSSFKMFSFSFSFKVCQETSVAVLRISSLTDSA